MIIDTLITQHCPNGVDFIPLGEVCPSIRTGKLNANEKDEDGLYPFFTCDAEPYRINTYAFDCEAILVTGNGSQVGHINYYKGKFNAYQRTYVLSSFKESVSIFFVLHFFRAYLKEYILVNSKKGSVPYITLPMLQNFLIPVPPLPVQEEIVRVLDTFTELQEELQKELQKRLQQYNYYRDKLLTNFTPDQGAQQFTLEEVTKDIYSGATPSKEKKEYWENGTIPWMSSGEVNLGQVYEVEGRITQLGYDKCSTKMVPEGSVVVALAGQGKTRGTVAILRTSVCTNQSLAALVPNTDFVSGEYLFHYLKTQYSKLREVSSGDGTRGGLNLKMLREYKITIPSKETQEQIVSILNKFEALTNDLTSGLPAEIEKRRQQYEYYRDKLLTFKRKEA